MFDRLRRLLGFSRPERERHRDSEPEFRPATLPPRRPETSHGNDLPGGNGWSARMGWRHITYIEAERKLSFQIEPMVVGADIVYIPDTQAWLQSAPPWAKSRASEILDRLKSIAWRRELQWSESFDSTFLTSDAPVPGSLESTPGGQQLEAERLFYPRCPLTHAQAHEAWHLAAQLFAEAARGRVTIFANGIDPKTVFGAIELPALQANPNVTLDFK